MYNILMQEVFTLHSHKLLSLYFVKYSSLRKVIQVNGLCTVLTRSTLTS